MRVILITFTLILVSLHTQAQSVQATFDKANTYFEEGELAKAMQLYRSIENSQKVSGALFLNMGITAVQLDSLGVAKYYFSKAADFDNFEMKAEKALKYVNAQFSRQSAKLPKLPWDKAIDWLNEGPGSFTVFIIGIIFICLGFSILIARYFDLLNLFKSKWFPGSFITLGVITLVISFYIDYVALRYQEGVVVVNSRKVLQEPTPQSNLVSIAYEGYDLTIDQWKSDDTGNWFYVRLGNGQFGWINRQGVKVL